MTKQYRHLPGCVMQRREAIRLFKEICECIPDAFVDGFSLIASSLNGEFELHMNTSLNTKGIENVQSLVSKHGLLLKEDKGIIVIYGSKQKTTEFEILA